MIPSVLECADHDVEAPWSTTSEDAMEVAVARPDVLARFWAKVHKTETCWLWIASVNLKGYGMFHLPRPVGRRIHAHRFAYEAVVGPIPDGLVLDHLCRTSLCVNPAHLEPVTNRENVTRGLRRSHCANGHAYTEENSYWRAGRNGYPWRECKECRLLSRRRWLAARGAR